MKTKLRVGALLAAGVAAAACQPKSEDQAAAPARPVLVVPAVQQQQVGSTFAGVVEPRFRTPLGFQVLGRISHRFVAVGDRLRPGQVLASLDPLTLQQAVRSAKAAADANAAQAEAATATDERSLKLRVTNAISASDADASKAAREVANASLAGAKADLARAQEQLNYADLTASYDGVVIEIQAEVGQVVDAGIPVMTVARTDALDAIIDVPSALAGELSPDETLTVSLQLDQRVQAIGTVREVAPAADPSTRTRRVRLELNNPPSGFRIGTTVTAILKRAVAPYIALPSTALFKAAGQTRVWVVDLDKNTVLSRPVKLSQSSGRTIRVVSGLNSGDLVVIAGANSLTEGELVALSGETSK